MMPRATPERSGYGSGMEIRGVVYAEAYLSNTKQPQGCGRHFDERHNEQVGPKHGRNIYETNGYDIEHTCGSIPGSGR